MLIVMLPSPVFAQAQVIPVANPNGVGPKPFIDYFRPIPIAGQLSNEVWGAATVGPRDPLNGLEDPTLKQWNYWDGKILRGGDGKYYMFASRWEQAKGHFDWHNSKAVEAVSDALLGPYREMGLVWPNDQAGKGHNVTALQLPDHSYAVVVSETRNGDLFAAKSITGPFSYLGPIVVKQDTFNSMRAVADPKTLHAPDPKPWRASNVSLTLRCDGGYEMIQRSGQILLSRSLLGPYEVQGDSIYRGLSGLPQDHLDHLEDPVLWFSGGWYHVVVNNWSDRRAYHLISRDGVTHWIYQGVAYYPDADFIRYTNGQINHWNKLERPGVYLENGHVTAITLAVIDVPKEQENGNDGHGSKIIVIPFDGAALDRDLANADAIH